MVPPSYMRAVVDRNVFMRRNLYVYVYVYIYTYILTLKIVRFVHVAHVHMYVSNVSCNKQLFPQPTCFCNNTLCSLWSRNKSS